MKQTQIELNTEMEHLIVYSQNGYNIQTKDQQRNRKCEQHYKPTGAHTHPRTLHTTAAEFTFLLNAHGTFSKKVHMSGLRKSKPKSIEII